MSRLVHLLRCRLRLMHIGVGSGVWDRVALKAAVGIFRRRDRAEIFFTVSSIVMMGSYSVIGEQYEGYSVYAYLDPIGRAFAFVHGV